MASSSSAICRAGSAGAWPFRPETDATALATPSTVVSWAAA